MTKLETVTFRCRGIDWPYKVWLDDGGWYWSVGSVDGTAQDEQEAHTLARRWIKEGVKGERRNSGEETR
jgi:hypothetical protein